MMQNSILMAKQNKRQATSNILQQLFKKFDAQGKTLGGFGLPSLLTKEALLDRDRLFHDPNIRLAKVAASESTLHSEQKAIDDFVINTSNTIVVN